MACGQSKHKEVQKVLLTKQLLLTIDYYVHQHISFYITYVAAHSFHEQKDHYGYFNCDCIHYFGLPLRLKTRPVQHRVHTVMHSVHSIV